MKLKKALTMKMKHYARVDPVFLKALGFRKDKHPCVTEADETWSNHAFDAVWGLFYSPNIHTKEKFAENLVREIIQLARHLNTPIPDLEKYITRDMTSD